MSSHRELVNAQQALNEAVEEFVRFVGITMGDRVTGPAVYVVARWHEFDAVRRKLDTDRPAARRDTSIAAAKRNPFKAGSDARKILLAIVARWKLYGQGMTSDLLEVQLKMPHQTCSARVNGLMARGFIRDAGERRETRSGSKAIAWQPTELALEWAAGMEE